MPLQPTTALRLFFATLSLLLVSGCADSSSSLAGPAGGEAERDSRPLRLIATTGHISDAVMRITEGTNPEIKLFCGPGVDPHSFSASTRDVQAMEDADAIFFNGFHLEARLDELLHDRYADKAWSMASAFPEKERLDWTEDGVIDPEAPFDPHIWNHLPAWAECVSGLTEQLAQLAPEHAEQYRSNGQQYVDEILETHAWAAAALGELPEDRRFLVSAHDAFHYFARNYDLETVAVLGIGNDPEADIRTMREVAETICDRRVPAIFMESITNPKVTTALQEACADRGWSVKIADQRLYSDDLGETSPQNTFLGAFRSNVEIIVGSLSGDTP